MTTPPLTVLRNAAYLTDPRIPLSITLSPTETSREHAHEFLELVLVISGHGTHLHRSPKGKLASYDIVENDVFLVPVNWSHGYKDSRHLSIYNILYTPDLIAADFPPDSTVHASGLFTGQPQHACAGLVHKLHLRHSERQNAESIIKSIRRELMTRRHGYEILAKARFLELLCLLDRAADDHALNNPEVSTTSGIGEAIRFVEDNYIRPIGLMDISQAAGLNANYLCERFGQATGISPVKYLTRLRIEHAKGLLSTTSLPVTEVAFQSGFSDSSYFARVFGRATGKTPRAFRSASSLI